MSRYIDADELRSFIKGQYFKCDMPEEWGNGVMWATSQINRYCNKVAPSIDIVKCKDCKWRKACKVFSQQQITDDSYCSWGEREGE